MVAAVGCLRRPRAGPLGVEECAGGHKRVPRNVGYAALAVFIPARLQLDTTREPSGWNGRRWWVAG